MHGKEHSLAKILEPFDPHRGWKHQRSKPKTESSGAPPDVELVEHAGVPEVNHDAPLSGDPVMRDIEFDNEHGLERTTTNQRHS